MACLIYLTKKDKDKTQFVLNHKMIERIIPLMDTIILMEDGKKIIVDEGPDQIIEKIIDFESEILLRIENKKEVKEL